MGNTEFCSDMERLRLHQFSENRTTEYHFQEALSAYVPPGVLPDETPGRVARAYQELMQGYNMDPLEPLRKRFPAPSQDIVCVKDIPFVSLCEHHVLPFTGHAHIAYIPNKEITGLSKFGRVLDILASRLQVQERLTAQIADAVQSLDPIGIAVILKAEHSCMGMRGVKKHATGTVTSAMRGKFFDDERARREVLELLKWK